MISNILPKEQAEARSNHQQLFIRYTLAILIDLNVLNIFNEYWDYVIIDTFSISFLTAVLLQLLLQVTIVIEHRIASYFKSKSGLRPKILRLFSSWIVLFISKLIILEAINFTFGSHVLFSGPIHGLVAFIIVVIAILVAEQFIIRIYKSLA